MQNLYLPKVSVIMNVHNGETYISESIQSVLNQNYENWELIIWDNNSKDKTSSIVSKFNDSRINYYHSTKFDKLYDARNKAIQRSVGDLITFLDSDDLWLPNKLYAQIIVMKNNSIDFCYSNYFLIGKQGFTKLSRRAFKFLPSGKIYKELINNYKVGILTLCIRRDVIFKYKNFFDSRFSIIGDMLFVLKLSQISSAYADQNCLACYRSHDQNLSKKKILMQVREMKIWFKDLKISGNWNPYELRNLISLTNYQRAKALSHKLSFSQIIKVTYKIKNIFLIFRFITFYFLKIFPKNICLIKLK